VVLRQQNVESLLWSFAGRFRGPIIARLFEREARRLAAWEARVINGMAATVALTQDDAAHLRAMAPHRVRIEVVPVPFAPQLPSGTASVEGFPAVVFLASRGWRPNIEAARRFVRDWWPHVLRRVSSAQLHVFGVDALTDGCDGVTWHGPPNDSAEAFPAGAIVAVPARHSTGVPMKGLEAWARGLPIIASPEAASALAATDGEDMLIAVDPESFAAAVRRLADDPELFDRLVAGGRAALRDRHDPETIAGNLTTVYESVL
jgi:hypothetical protein